MNEYDLEFIINCGVGIAWLLAWVVVPLCCVCLALICSWLDDGEKTFTYPWPHVALPYWLPVIYKRLDDWGYCELRRLHVSSYDIKRGGMSRYDTDDGHSGTIIVLFLGHVILSTLDYHVTSFHVVWWVGGITAGLYLFKRTFRLGKTLNKHISNKEIHS